MSDLLKRLDKLADRLMATTQFGPSAHTVLEAKADIEQSIAYMAGIETDARRYRFLRDEAYNLDAVPYVVTGPHGATEPITGAELDKAIDERPELVTSNPNPAGNERGASAVDRGRNVPAGVGTDEVTGVGKETHGENDVDGLQQREPEAQAASATHHAQDGAATVVTAGRDRQPLEERPKSGNNSELLAAVKDARSVLRIADRSRAWQIERDRILGELDVVISESEERPPLGNKS